MKLRDEEAWMLPKAVWPGLRVSPPALPAPFIPDGRSPVPVLIFPAAPAKCSTCLIDLRGLRVMDLRD